MYVCINTRNILMICIQLIQLHNQHMCTYAACVCVCVCVCTRITISICACVCARACMHVFLFVFTIILTIYRWLLILKQDYQYFFVHSCISIHFFSIYFHFLFVEQKNLNFYLLWVSIQELIFLWPWKGDNTGCIEKLKKCKAWVLVFPSIYIYIYMI